MDFSKVSADKLRGAAEIVKASKDVKLPELKFLNSAPCDRHTEPSLQCSQCGIKLRRHQRIAVAWLYLVGSGILSDTTGAGKTHSITGLLALLRHYSPDLKAVVICRSSAAHQWHDELHRALNRTNIVVADGVKKKRLEKYAADWDVLITGFQMLGNDLEELLEFDIDVIIIDDIDTLRERRNRSAYSIKRLSRRSERVVITNATPFHKRLIELYSVLEPVGGRDVLGSESQYKRDHIRGTKFDPYYVNIEGLKRKIRPLILRRTAADLDDVEMPAVVSSNIFLDLYPAQRQKYRELQAGVLRIIHEQGETVKRVDALAKVTYGSKICDGLCTLGESDLPETSVKLDWLEQLLTGDFSEEKVVVFSRFKNTIRALISRLNNHGISYELIWGEQRDSSQRAASQRRFWEDPNCKVLIGTTAITSSLNLHVSRHLVAIDQIINQAVMNQLVGRVKRIGSVYETVYVHNLLTNGTHESRYLNLLSREQAIFNATFDDTIDLYPQLSPIQLLALIGGSSDL